MSRLMPALSDGRTFTSYLSAGLAEEGLQRQLSLVNENQYRSYLQHNAPNVASKLRFESLRGAMPPYGTSSFGGAGRR